MLHERFRKKDIVGIGFSIAGAVTIVLSSKSENKSVSFLCRTTSAGAYVLKPLDSSHRISLYGLFPSLPSSFMPLCPSD